MLPLLLFSSLPLGLDVDVEVSMHGVSGQEGEGFIQPEWYAFDGDEPTGTRSKHFTRDLAIPNDFPEGFIQGGAQPTLTLLHSARGIK